MAKASSIHFCPAKVSADKHNKREKELSYVRKELEVNIPHDKWCWEDPRYKSVYALRKQAEKEYAEKEITVTGNHGTYVTHRSMPKTAEPVKEGVVAINPNVTMEQLRAFASWTHDQYGITPMGIYIHLGEGHWAPLDQEQGQTEDMYRRDDGHEWMRVNDAGEKEYWKPNYHAHILYDWFDHENTKRCYNLGPSIMRTMEDALSQFLGMERGKPSGRKWEDAVAYKAKAEQKRYAQEKAKHESEIDKLQTDIAKYNKAKASLTTMIANLEERVNELENEIENIRLDKDLEETEKNKLIADKTSELNIVQHKLTDKQQKLDVKTAEIAKAEAQLKSVNDNIADAEQKAAQKEHEAESRISQAEKRMADKEAEEHAETQRIDRDKTVSEEKLQILKGYAAAAEVGKEELKYNLLSLTKEETTLMNAIMAEIATPTGAFQSAKSWREDRAKNIEKAIEDFNASINNRVATANASLKGSINNMYTYYMQQLDKLKDNNDSLSAASEAKVKSDVLRAILKDMQHTELSYEAENNPDNLGIVLKSIYDRQINGMADYLFQTTYHHRSKDDLKALANEWQVWRAGNAKLFDKGGKFDAALKEASFALSDKVWENKDGILKAFNDLMKVAENNANSPFYWGKANAMNVADAVRIITSPHLNYSQDEKTKAVLDDVINKADVTLAENERNQKMTQQRAAEDVRQAYVSSLYNSQTMKTAVKDIVAKSSDPRAHNLNPSQTLNIIAALGMFSGDEREAAADKMMEMARAEASCTKAWLDSTAEEVNAIVENFAQIAVILALPTQGAAISTGGGGGGGNNDLPKKRDDDWWNKLCKIMGSGKKKGGGIGR